MAQTQGNQDSQRPSQAELLAAVDRKARSGDPNWTQQLTDDECAAAADWINRHLFGS